MTTTFDSKNAEFARLFDLFDRLASRKPRNPTRDDNTTAMDDIQAMSLPPDLAPVVNSLANLVGTRKYKEEKRQQKATFGRERSKTIATTSRNIGKNDSDEGYEESLANFPIGKKYPFTFKLMLHKLYQLEDWAQKVKEVLERSQIEYKPLSEYGLDATEESKEKLEEGRVHFKAGIVGSNRESKGRQRSHSVIVPRKDGATIGVGALKYSAPEEEVRVVKKRCVGRRKSLNALGSEVGRIGGNWVYDAAVSSTEITGRREPPMPKASGGVRVSGYPPIAVEGRPKVVGKRRLSLGAPNVVAQPSYLGGTSITRRRALSVMDNLPPVQVQRKRPLEF